MVAHLRLTVCGASHGPILRETPAMFSCVLEAMMLLVHHAGFISGGAGDAPLEICFPHL